MSYFADTDKQKYELIPNGTTVKATIKSLTKKSANNGKKYLELSVEIDSQLYQGRRLWRTFWFDNNTSKYDARGLAILTRIVCESNGFDFKEVQENIESEDDICSFVKNKKIGIEVSINFYTKTTGEEASVNRIAKFINVKDIEELVSVENTQEEKVLDIEQDLPFEQEDDLPF